MSLNLFSQNEYQVDNDFIGLKSKKENIKVYNLLNFDITCFPIYRDRYVYLFYDMDDGFFSV